MTSGAIEKQAQRSLAHSQARRKTAKTRRREQRLTWAFSLAAAVGAFLLVTQIVSADPVPWLVFAGVLLVIPLASLPKVRL